MADNKVTYLVCGWILAITAKAPTDIIIDRDSPITELITALKIMTFSIYLVSGVVSYRLDSPVWLTLGVLSQVLTYIIPYTTNMIYVDNTPDCNCNCTSIY